MLVGGWSGRWLRRDDVCVCRSVWQIRGNKTALPLRNWEEGKLSRELMMAIEELQWKEPSPIQRAAIPIGLERRDIIGIAETGSGKTGAFAIPMINYCLSVPQSYRDR